MNSTQKNAIADVLRVKTGLKITDFAKEKGVSRKEIYKAIAGDGSRKIRLEIAKIIDLPPSIIWQSESNARIIDDVTYYRQKAQ